MRPSPSGRVPFFVSHRCGVDYVPGLEPYLLTTYVLLMVGLVTLLPWTCWLAATRGRLAVHRVSPEVQRTCANALLAYLEHSDRLWETHMSPADRDALVVRAKASDLILDIMESTKRVKNVSVAIAKGAAVAMAQVAEALDMAAAEQVPMEIMEVNAIGRCPETQRLLHPPKVTCLTSPRPSHSRRLNS